MTLDEKEFTLNSSNLVICDGVKPVALAGIMGGLNSEIKATTTEVMFESAKFARDNIRKSSRALGQSSDSSAMYAKGVYEYTTVMAMKRALHLVEELGCGKVSSTQLEVSTGNSIEPKEMKVSVKRVNGVLGIEVPEEDMLRILSALILSILLWSPQSVNRQAFSIHNFFSLLAFSLAFSFSSSYTASFHSIHFLRSRVTALVRIFDTAA